MIVSLVMALAAATAAPAPAAKPTDRAPAPAAADAPERRYCVVTTPSNSRIPQRDCRTRAAWLRDGYDPLARD